MLLILGNTVEFTDLYTHKEQPGARCEIKARQSWAVDVQNSSISVSDVDDLYTRVGHYEGYCEPIPHPKNRTHHYELKKDQLTITFSKEYIDAMDFPTLCEKGLESVTYKKAL